VIKHRTAAADLGLLDRKNRGQRRKAMGCPVGGSGDDELRALQQPPTVGYLLAGFYKYGHQWRLNHRPARVQLTIGL
jgi:hypothetical protein